MGENMQDTLTIEKMERIHRCRLRYLAGLPVPASDLHALGLSPDVNGAREVLGVYLGARGEPCVEGSILPVYPVINFDAVVS